MQKRTFAIDQIQEERKIQIPIMVSGTITDASGRTLGGQTAGSIFGFCFSS